MKRSKKVVFACHCLLNQNARAQSVAKCAGVCKEFVNYCLQNDCGIVPIDCPQLEFEPLIREPATKEIYQNEQARQASRRIAQKVVKQIKIYLDAGYKVCGIFGTEGSPTCAVVRTHVLSPEGKPIGKNECGIFIEELQKALSEANLSVPLFDWDIQAKRSLKSPLHQPR